jgi:hypothetical protein
VPGAERRSRAGIQGATGSTSRPGWPSPPPRTCGPVTVGSRRDRRLATPLLMRSSRRGAKGVAPPLRCQPLRRAASRTPDRISAARTRRSPTPLRRDRGMLWPVSHGPAGTRADPRNRQRHPFLRAPITATVDPKSARKDQPTRRSRCLWVCPTPYRSRLGLPSASPKQSASRHCDDAVPGARVDPHARPGHGVVRMLTGPPPLSSNDATGGAAQAPLLRRRFLPPGHPS